jgi:hypothetical protein
MITLLSTLISFLAGGLPKILDFFQDRSDKKQELALAQIQTERELALAERGFLAQQKVEEIRSDQIAMQTTADVHSVPCCNMILPLGRVLVPGLLIFVLLCVLSSLTVCLVCWHSLTSLVAGMLFIKE